MRTSEFIATVVEDGPGGMEIRHVTEDDLRGPKNRDELDPKDGPLLKMCDRLAAFIEADTALRNGINNEQLHQARWRIRQMYEHRPEVMGIQVGALLADFDGARPAQSLPPRPVPRPPRRWLRACIWWPRPSATTPTSRPAPATC